jgi:hypothetical protein
LKEDLPLIQKQFEDDNIIDPGMIRDKGVDTRRKVGLSARA